MGGLVWQLSSKAWQHAETPTSWGMFVYGEDTSKVPMMAVLGDLFFDGFKFAEKVWSVVDERRSL